MSEVKCPKCGSSDFVRKGKTKNKQFQRLQCKTCNKRFQVETSIVNRQRLPQKEIRIVKHPDGAFSINLVRYIDVGRKNPRIENQKYLTNKVNTYKEIVYLSKTYKSPINPHEIKLDRLLSNILIDEIKLAFQPTVSQAIINLLEKIARGLGWSSDV